MVKILAAGGFGNQLFIWSQAHAMVARTGRRIEIFYVKDRSSKPSELNLLVSLVPFCHHNIKVRKSNLLGLYLRIYDKLISLGFGKSSLFKKVFKIISAEDISIIPNLPENKSFVLRGFFQNYELVDFVWKNISDEILTFLDTIIFPPILENILLPLQVVHVRRGDYNLVKSEFGILSLDYFKENLLRDFNSIVCTDEEDDIQSISNHLNIDKIFSSQLLDTMQTFKLMIMSDRLIISNSTFSWWAGFFVARSGGTVIYPAPWFVREKLGNNNLQNPDFTKATAKFES